MLAPLIGKKWVWSQIPLDRNARWAQTMTKCLLHGASVERPMMYLCDDIFGDALVTLARVFYETTAYS